jgi:hypothetical protein
MGGKAVSRSESRDSMDADVAYLINLQTRRTNQPRDIQIRQLLTWVVIFAAQRRPEPTGNGSQGARMVKIPSAMLQMAKYLPWFIIKQSHNILPN